MWQNGHVWLPMELILIFIDDVTVHKSIRVNFKVFQVTVSAHIQPNSLELI